MAKLGGSEADKKAKFEALVAKQMDALKKSGMTSAQARQTLKTWAEMGAKDEKELRALLLKRSLKPVSSLGTQLVLDIGCSTGAFVVAGGLGSSNLPGAIALQIVFYFGACWYAIQALAEAGALGAVVVAARRYSTDSDAIMAAVQQIAGPSSGIGPLESAKLAVNTVKVVAALQEISEDLKTLSGSDKLEASTLRSLSAFLALQNARDKYGFDSEKYGLTDSQASDIATVFSEFDANDDGRLELSELRRLCGVVGRELSDPEIKEGIRLLGSRDGSHIYFTDFAEWYLGIRPSQPTGSQPAAASK